MWEEVSCGDTVKLYIKDNDTGRSYYRGDCWNCKADIEILRESEIKSIFDNFGVNKELIQW